jgi:SpoVK/Ycf46/Vps4 family AAA+-type ATPase
MSDAQATVKSQRDLEEMIRARYPLIYIVSSEERRVEKQLEDVAKRRERRLEAWSITSGFTTLFGGRGDRDIKDPDKALDYVLKGEGTCLYVLRDFHPYLKDPKIVRKVRDVAHKLKSTKNTCIILSAVTTIPQEWEKEVAVVDWDLPTRGELAELIQHMMPNIADNYRQDINDDPAFRDKIVEAALGLTQTEAENVYARSVVRTKTFDITTILEEKKHIIRKSGILDYQEAQEKIEDIGGLEILKSWLLKRKGAFTQKARDFGLPLPKGILLIGVPGCGKSLTAKTVGALWQMPLLRLDVGKIFGGLVGQSEDNIRKVIKTAESIAPAVLWLDELEKGFSGTGSSNMSDGGTTSRVFGTFITWLQEKNTPVFVLATANDVTQLPPELLRKGRFDEIFFVDLPTREERRAIIEIHIRKKQRDPGKFDLDAVVDQTQEFSGAEMEQAVVAAMFDAFDAGKDLDTDHLLEAVKDIVPLSVTMKERIDGMREWSKSRARRASMAKPGSTEGGPPSGRGPEKALAALDARELEV